jgi:phosphoribosylanthranilate isomerase
MALKTNVLVENISNLSEARYCAGMGVQFLAFPAMQVDATLFTAIKGWVQGPQMVIDISEIDNQLLTANDYGADFILVDCAQLPKINDPVLPLIVRLPAKKDLDVNDLSLYAGKIEYLIVNNASKNEVQKLHASGYKMLVSTAEGSMNVEEILTWPIDGIVLKGETETKPGLKNYDHLSFILDELEIDEA